MKIAPALVSWCSTAAGSRTCRFTCSAAKRLASTISSPMVGPTTNAEKLISARLMASARWRRGSWARISAATALASDCDVVSRKQLPGVVLGLGEQVGGNVRGDAGLVGDGEDLAGS